MKTVLLTGAAGIVGTALRPLLAARYPRVLLSDIAPVDDLREGETFEQGDIANLEFVSRITQEVDGVVHLAGMVGPSYTFDEVLGPNIVGTYNIFEAARRNGVVRLVYASSHHAVGFCSRDEPVDEITPPRPDSWYGVSKVFGESVGSYYADKYGLEVMSIRIGFVGEEVVDERRLHTWNSPRDLSDLISIGLEEPIDGHVIVYGVSECPDSFFRNDIAEKLGYRPKDKAVNHLTDPAILEARPDVSSIAGRVIGGPFAVDDNPRETGR
ncbi:NAD-dependent epimerase/dehydratase family protein [Stratiformator vulcanicus]|uniref:dTDP-glucose 4,6-dehydratase n=1 Tax=Stratiformator vulcanicus TaxID=2527980 RepID=A0A517R2Z5_9PLAN|nr:NAD(P)-dependent oxidoreductase [Stratiformator vulcanicus]QDT38255.1 dTDP-glucose 4,6-dehydratase [Stratiformator vulcanicus]